MISKNDLEELYIRQNLSMQQIATLKSCSVHKVTYWMQRHAIPRRSISDAIYTLKNPNGDPFTVTLIKTIEQAELYGWGMGLFWGEGNKVDKWTVRLGNTDPALIRKFMQFLIELFGVKREDLRFTLQIFTDIEPAAALEYWTSQLKVSVTQFYRPTVTPARSLGTYRKKSLYGVVQVSYHNKKLRDLIIGALPR